MSEDVQNTDETSAQQPTEDKDKKSTVKDTKDKTTATKPTKSQINISSELKEKLENLKKSKNESFDSVVQRLWDSYKKKNIIVDNKINNIDEIKAMLLNTIDQLSPSYPINNNGAITYIENNNSLLYKLIGAVILEQSNEEVNKNLLKSIQQVVKAVNDLMTTLGSIDISSVTKEMYWSSYNTYLNEIMNNKITLNNQARQDYAQRITVLDSWNQCYNSIVNAIPK